MREFRTAARSVRSADAEHAHTDDGTEKADRWRVHGQRPGLYVVPGQEAGQYQVSESVAGAGHRVPPLIQREAWRWALDRREEDGSLPTGEENAAAFDRKPRWGRLVKQKGQGGHFGGGTSDLVEGRPVAVG